MKFDDVLFVGANRRVRAIEQKSGRVIWEVKFGGIFGDQFVHVFLDRENLFACNKGTLYCLDPSDGKIRWENSLYDWGYYPTFASVGGSTGNLAAIVANMRAQQAAAASYTG